MENKSCPLPNCEGDYPNCELVVIDHTKGGGTSSHKIIHDHPNLGCRLLPVDVSPPVKEKKPNAKTTNSETT